MVAVPLLVLGILFSAGTAFGVFDSAEWQHFRRIQIPADFYRGQVVIPLESAILEECRPDMADLRVISSNGELVPIKLEIPEPTTASRPFPAEVYRVARRPGKWTDVWIDKSGKIITRGILIQTSSEDFVRTVEIRGSDNGQESYVIRMDGLIASRRAPVPFRSLKIEHSPNNFKHLHLRLLDEGGPSLTVESVLCYPPAAEPTGLIPLAARIMENRTDTASNSTVIVADLGEKRFPLCGIEISSPVASFVKNVSLRISSSATTGDWKEIFEGTFFRLHKSGAVKENLKARFKPQPSRFLMVVLSGPGGPPVAVDGLEALAAVPRAVFEYRGGQKYRLFYGNALARGLPTATVRSAMNVTATDPVSSEVRLGKQEKNVVPPRSKESRPDDEDKGTGDAVGLVGLIMLLSALLLLFGLMLTFRRIAKPRHRASGRMSNAQ
jgi:hypothetical protein